MASTGDVTAAERRTPRCRASPLESSDPSAVGRVLPSSLPWLSAGEIPSIHVIGAPELARSQAAIATARAEGIQRKIGTDADERTSVTVR